MAAERKDAAARANAAEREGKPLPTSKPGGSSFADELALLDDRIADEKERFAALTDKLNTLAERAKSTRSELLRALARVAELDYQQWIEDGRRIRERRDATVRAAGMGHLLSDQLPPVDEVAVQTIVKELQIEHRGGWEQSAALTAPPMPAEANATEGAEPGAQAVA
jgi:AraC-like DNA-binding protein